MSRCMEISKDGLILGADVAIASPVQRRKRAIIHAGGGLEPDAVRAHVLLQMLLAIGCAPFLLAKVLRKDGVIFTPRIRTCIHAKYT